MEGTAATASYSDQARSSEAVRLNGWDIGTVVLYFLLVIGVGLIASCRTNRGSVKGYFLAGKTMTWLPVGASLFVSNIGSEHFIGLAGSGAAIGFAVGAWEVNALIILQMLGFLFVPIYISSGVVTMPEYLFKRFGGKRLRVSIAVLSLLLYIFTKVSVNLYSGALFIQQSLGWNIYLSMIGLILITAILTMTGGLTAVIYTDTLQAILMIGGATSLTIISLIRVGGFEAMKKKYLLATPNVTTNSLLDPDCGKPFNDSFIMLREPTDPDVPWPGFVLGQTWATTWYWCTDQVIVQRVLAAKNLSHAQGATVLAGFLKILPFFIMVIPGLISRILYPDEVACVDPLVCERVCQTPSGCTNIAFPRLILGVMPTGARGLMMSVMIAALMSDLDSIFNSSSTLFTLDIWKRVVRRKASVRELMIVGRLWILAMVCLSIAWVPVLVQLQNGQLFLSIQEVSGYLAPPIAVIFVLGIFWKRCNEKGAFWGLIAGFVVGIIRLIMVFSMQGRAGSCYKPDTRPEWFIKLVADIHFMYFTIIIVAITIIIAVVISLMTEPPTKNQICRTTWWTKHWDRLRKDSLEYELTDKLKSLKQPMIEEDASMEPTTISSSGTLPRLFNWFCGFNVEEEALSDSENDEKERNNSSIEQRQWEKITLQVFMVIILCIGVYLLAYFSTPT